MAWLMSAAVVGVMLSGCASLGAQPESTLLTATSESTSSPRVIASAGPTAPVIQPTSSTPSPTAPADSPTATTAVSPSPTGLTWKPVGRTVGGRPAVQIATTDSGAIGLMWMDPTKLTFRYVPGYEIPEKGPRMAQDKEPVTWLSGLVAAFNGAFHLRDNAGGYYYDGTMVRPLRAGLASIVTGVDGSMHVVVWADYMTPQPGTLAIRQNLPPLVLDGVSQPTSHDGTAKWGLADDGLPHANRSALGETTDGALIFAYGHEVTAAALAAALVQAHVTTAIVLDMNKSWPTGFFYDAPSTALSAPVSSPPKPVGHRIQAGIQRDPSTYFTQFKKDFFVALARDSTAQTPSASPAPSLP